MKEEQEIIRFVWWWTSDKKCGFVYSFRYTDELSSIDKYMQLHPNTQEGIELALSNPLYFKVSIKKL